MVLMRYNPYRRVWGAFHWEPVNFRW